MRRNSVLLLALPAGLLAQVDRGTIAGTIVDPSGAVVVGAAVRILNTATNAAQQSVTSNAGTYGFFSLPIGLYDITVEAQGFRRSEAKAVRVEVNQQSRLDMTL
jgi:preprotein translocase subunit Sec61beta